jgi:hypothetical protein
MRNPGERHGNEMWTWTSRIQPAHKAQKYSTAPWFRIKERRYVSQLLWSEDNLNRGFAILPSLPLYHPSTTLLPNKSFSLNTTTRKRSGPTLRMILAGPSTIRWRVLLLGLWVP